MKKEFPFFEKTNNIYLDSASTTQKPKEVLDAVSEYNEILNSNAGRGAYKLAFNSTNIMEECRNKLSEYFNASKYDIVFTKNATESINLLAYTYGNTLQKGDEIILCKSNHHANIVVWQYIAKTRNLILKYVDIAKDGRLDTNHLKNLITNKTKLLAISHIVNTTGIENDISSIKETIENRDIKLLLDISQTVSHKKIDVDSIDADFYVLSAHKMFAPMGLGILIGKKDILNDIPPFLYGGDMIEYVEEQDTTFKPSPYKFEGGTQNISSIYGMIKAIEYMKNNLDKIQSIEKELHTYLLQELDKLDYVEIYNRQTEIPITAFNIKNIHSHDVGSILDFHNVSIRTGQHCTALLMKALNINSCCRVSISAYNTKEDIDKLIYAIKDVYRLFSVGCGM